MRLVVGVVLVAVSACSSVKEAETEARISLPQVYPPVRAATPSELILDTEFGELAEALLLQDGGATDPPAPADDAGAPSVDAGPSASAEAPADDAAVVPDDAGVELPADDAAATPSSSGDAAAALDGGGFTLADASNPVDGSVPAPGSNTAPLPASGGPSMPVPPGGMPTMPVPPGGGTMPMPPGGMPTMPVPPGGSMSPGGVATMPMPPGAGSAGPLQPGAINLATAIQERFYSEGPTSLLRIVKELDDRVRGLETDPEQHPCLTEEPVASSYALPGGQSFGVKLQCLERSGSTWLAFGFDRAAAADAGSVKVDDTNDFFLVTGQEGGMGGAYRIFGKTGDVEGWITVADKTAPMNSQVILHLFADKRAGTLELSLAGSGVGFCAAHLKTSATHLWVSGKTNGVAPPGSALPDGAQYCDAARSGCFKATALDGDLGADSTSCADIAAGTFKLNETLDASTDADANVTPATLYDIFDGVPVGIATF